ncbi:Glucose dehydrogenase [FAD, quinone] [Leucoagaricus sp. SymC.cos]|nr:Glucose dehydrogenase [FAD, quinone] [Leucoagaricus sp. SymC.cos]
MMPRWCTIPAFLSFTTLVYGVRYFQKPADLPSVDYDFIIVGGGLAGAVVATRLGEIEDFKVLVIEAGPSNRDVFETEKWSSPNDPSLSEEGHFDPSVHSKSGKLGTTAAYFPHPSNDLMIDVTKELGDEFPLLRDLNAGRPIGLGWSQSTTAHGQRSSSATAYLEHASDNVHVLLRTRVVRVLPVDQNGAGNDFRMIELATSPTSPILNLTARKEVVISGGSINTPQIMLLSGIGPKDELEALGIKTIIDNPSVGKNFSDQPSISVGFSTNLPDTTTFNQTAALAQWKSNHTGQLAVPLHLSQTGWIRFPPDAEPFKDGSIDPSAGTNSPHIELFFGGVGKNLATNSIWDQPVIDPNLLATPLDLAILVEGFMSAQRLFASKTFSEHVFGLSFPAPANGSITKDEIVSYIQRTASHYGHGVGSCSMAPRGASWGVVGPDFKVRGGGTAGAVVGARLGEVSKYKILVIEAGPSNHDVFDSQVPGLAMKIGFQTAVDWNYTTVPQVNVNNAVINYPRAMLLGGCSSHSTHSHFRILVQRFIHVSNKQDQMVYTRGSRDDYDRWAKVTGNDNLSWDKILPYILKAEKLTSPNDPNFPEDGHFDPSYHSTTGAVSVSAAYYPHPFNDLMLNTTNELSKEFPFLLDVNSGRPLGIGWGQTTVEHGFRSSAATSYIANARNNVHVLLQTRITRVLPVDKERRDFRKVEFATKPEGPRMTLTAKKELILSAGAMNSPQILLLSGIGPKAELEAVGIENIVDNPSVGKNFSEQVALQINFTTSLPVTDFDEAAALTQWKLNHTGRLGVPLRLPQIGWHRLPASSEAFKNGSSDPTGGPDTPHVEFYFWGIGAPSNSSTGTDDLSVGSLITDVVNLNPASRGSITLSSSSPFDPPKIDPALLGSPLDAAILLEGVKSLLRLLSSTTFATHIQGFTSSGPSSNDTEAIINYMEHSASHWGHPVGSCAMAPHGATWGVVDPDFKLRGLNGLRVVDASVFPFVTSGHTQAPVYAVAELASEVIKDHSVKILGQNRNQDVFDSQVPGLALNIGIQTAYDWNYTTPPQVNVNNVVLKFSRAMPLGGCSSHSWGQTTNTHRFRSSAATSYLSNPDGHGPRTTSTVKKELILSAGIMNSPQILSLSGIGPKAEPDALSIENILYNSSVGENFSNQLPLPVSFVTSLPATDSFDGAVALTQWNLNHTGRLAVPLRLPQMGWVHLPASSEVFKDGSADRTGGPDTPHIEFYIEGINTPSASQAGGNVSLTFDVVNLNPVSCELVYLNNQVQ